MNKVIYYVACSIDGYICGEGADVTGFLGEGDGVQKYLNDLKEFKTVIMGRKTYESGYQFGLKPGEPPYPHMEHYVFSKTLVLEDAAPNVHIKELELKELSLILKASDSDVYLCGGGELAGFLLENEYIDVVKIKLNPLLLGQGVKLFENSKKAYQLNLLSAESFEAGLQILTYEVKY